MSILKHFNSVYFKEELEKNALNNPIQFEEVRRNLSATAGHIDNPHPFAQTPIFEPTRIPHVSMQNSRALQVIPRNMPRTNTFGSQISRGIGSAMNWAKRNPKLAIGIGAATAGLGVGKMLAGGGQRAQQAY